MAGGEVVTGARGTRPMGHGSKNRRHQEKEGAGELGQADTAAGGRSRGGGRHGRRPGAIGRMRNGSRSHETRNKLHGEREGRTTKLTAGKNGVDGGLETADHAEADGGSRRTLRRLLWLPRRLANAKKRAGRQQGCMRGFVTL